jgi:hypothetical protein
MGNILRKQVPMPNIRKLARRTYVWKCDGINGIFYLYAIYQDDGRYFLSTIYPSGNDVSSGSNNSAYNEIMYMLDDMRSKSYKFYELSDNEIIKNFGKVLKMTTIAELYIPIPAKIEYGDHCVLRLSDKFIKTLFK